MPTDAERPTVERLDSGYWHVRWCDEIWAQWPCGRACEPGDFFHDTSTVARIVEANRLTGEYRDD